MVCRSLSLPVSSCGLILEQGSTWKRVRLEKKKDALQCRVLDIDVSICRFCRKASNGLHLAPVGAKITL